MSSDEPNETVISPQTLDFRMRCMPRRSEEFWNYPRDRTLRRIFRQMVSGLLPRLLIFWGLFGCAKTATAYYIAQWANCSKLRQDGHPCGDCQGCRAVHVRENCTRDGFVELDGTWNDIADEIERAYGTTFTKKGEEPRPWIVLIDEAHRMPPKGQELLLKLCEKWHRARIILATTNLDRIDGGLLSRGTTYEFCYPTPQEAAHHLERIARQYGVVLTTEAARLISTRRNGTPRECLGDLYELLAYGPEIGVDVVRDLYDGPGDTTSDRPEVERLANGGDEVSVY